MGRLRQLRDYTFQDLDVPGLDAAFRVRFTFLEDEGDEFAHPVTDIPAWSEPGLVVRCAIYRGEHGPRYVEGRFERGLHADVQMIPDTELMQRLSEVLPLVIAEVGRWRASV